MLTFADFVAFRRKKMYNVFNVVIIVVHWEVIMLNANDLLKKAIDEIQNLDSGEKFLVKDLFKGYEWNRIPLKSRLLLGTLFLNYISSESKEVIVIEKTSANQQKYKKR